MCHKRRQGCKSVTRPTPEEVNVLKDLVDTVTASETPLAVWFDEDTHEVGVQYGYVVLSLPREDFADLANACAEARDQL